LSWLAKALPGAASLTANREAPGDQAALYLKTLLAFAGTTVVRSTSGGMGIVSREEVTLDW